MNDLSVNNDESHFAGAEQKLRKKKRRKRGAFRRLRKTGRDEMMRRWRGAVHNKQTAIQEKHKVAGHT